MITSDFDLGHTTIGGDTSVSYDGWFSFSASADHISDSETLNTYDENSQVSIKLLYDTIQKVTITPGSWYVLPKDVLFSLV